MLKTQKAIILHRVEDAKHCIANNLYYDSILFSTNSSVDTYLKYEHNIDCKCLTYFLEEQYIIKEIKSACGEADNIIKELDMQFSAAINEFYGFKNMAFFRSLYASALRYYFADCKTILVALDLIVEQYNLKHLLVYELKDKFVFEMPIEIMDIISLLDKKIQVEIIHNQAKTAKKSKFKKIFKALHKIPFKIYEHIKDLRYLYLKDGRDTILLYEVLYDLVFLKRRLKNFNILYYRAYDCYPLFLRKQKAGMGSFKLDIGNGKDTLKDLAKNKIKEHFENKIEGYVNAIKSLEVLHERYNIKLAISGNMPIFDVKLIIFEYLRSRNIPIILAAHGFNYGLQDRFGGHITYDYNRCDYFISYGFTKKDLFNLYGEEAKLVKCEILPYGSKLLRQTLRVGAKKKKTIDILFPITINDSFFSAGVLSSMKPELLTEIQIKLLHYLDTKKRYSVVVKPLFEYHNYSGCSVIPVLKRLKNVRIIDYLSFSEALEEFDVKSVLIEYITTALGEAIPYDVEIFAFGSSRDFFAQNALELIKKRAYYSTDVEELKRLMDLFLEKSLPAKRNDEFLRRFLIKENTQGYILKFINLLVGKDNIALSKELERYRC